MLDAILHKNMPAIAKKLVTAAKSGEHWAVTLALKNQLPNRAGTPFDLPEIKDASDLPAASRAVLTQMAEGLLTSAEAASAMQALEGYGRIATLSGHEERLAALEARLGVDNSRKTGAD
jgi:hypothetical protein